MSQHKCEKCGKEFDTVNGKRTHSTTVHDHPWQQKSVLQNHVDNGLSVGEIAEIYGVTPPTIRRNAKNLEIDANVYTVHELPYLRTNNYGHEVIQHCYNGNRYRFYLHRLLAVSEHGFDRVKDNVVHHTNHIPWDNRPDNIELMQFGKHSSLHNG